MKKKVLVLGTAPDTFVEAFVKSLNDELHIIHLAFSENRGSRFNHLSCFRHSFQGMIRWNSLKLLLIFLRIRPDEIVMVRGAAWFHNNVIATVDFWRSFYDVAFKISLEGGAADYHPMANSPTRASLLAFFFFSGMLISLCAITGHLPAMIVGISVLEMILRLHGSMMAYDQKRKAEMILHRIGTGKLHTMPHPEYGWVNIPNTSGHYRTEVSGFQPSVYEWHYRHDMEGCRQTSDQATAMDGKPIIHIIGCSITYGQFVNDEETYAWLLQDRYKEFRFKNYAVGAYSLLPMYLRLKQSIEKDQPVIVVLGFHQELEQRCTNPFEHRIFWLRNLKSPSCKSVKKKLRYYPPSGYERLPFSDQIKTVALGEYLFNRLRFFGRAKPELMRRTNEHLLFLIRALCEKHGAGFLVACIDNSESYYEFFHHHGFSWCITGVSSEDLHKWTVYPFDGHPNSGAHARYCDVISEAFEKVLKGKHVTPEAVYLKDMKNDFDRGKGHIYPHF